MKCPKCGGTRNPADRECGDCGVVFKDIRGGRGSRSFDAPVDRNCPWNDHGQICGDIGSVSDATNGSGPWYCSRHYWQMKGYGDVGAAVPAKPFDHAAYCAELGLDIREKQMAFIRDILKNGKIGKGGTKPMREPGEDEDFILGTQP